MNIVKQPHMKNNFAIAIPLFFLVLSTGCTLHKVDIQQGNIVSQKMMAALKTGMKRDEVERVMGRPMIVDPFRRDRWDYVHAFKSGKSDAPRSQYRVTLFFEGERLARIERDVPLESLPLR